ncbi:MAG: integrin alpha [Myxococcota bacterium]
MSKAAGAAEVCTRKMKRGEHGWLGLVRHESKWELVPLHTRPSEGGDSSPGLCAVESPWEDVALQGKALRKGPVDGVALDVDDSTCRLPEKAKVLLGDKSWTFSVKGKSAVAATSGEAKLSFPLESDCWTVAWLGDLDGDMKPDLLVGRSGGGSVFALFLSSSQRAGVVGQAASMSGPAD